ncbi:hypothetical protein PIIN_10415 [Serendipita indica DSM 11827]|uniref:Uncharacterized protein n=1 Tax=Serendipita indica (strain DSM 11827) TaxID=1109443 RepID=G4TYM9_SERID|nr:hypothetical protein PIIN_10415 [Serendipita indica DSM 11827]
MPQITLALQNAFGPQFRGQGIKGPANVCLSNWKQRYSLYVVKSRTGMELTTLPRSRSRYCKDKKPSQVIHIRPSGHYIDI